MKRREFVAGLVAVVMPTALSAFDAQAQRTAKAPKIGFLGPTTPEIASRWIESFAKRLAELGWIEGRTVVIEYRWAGARAERYTDIASEFVSQDVDVIVTWASAPVLAAKRATTIIPIVFAAQMDPVGAGVVKSLARPGGNITGMSIQQTDTAGKRLELLREVVPNLHRIAIMGNMNAPGAVIEMNQLDATAQSLGLQVSRHGIRQAEEIASTMETLKTGADAIYIATDPLIFDNRIRINALAREARLPTIYGSREYVDAGALLSYGPSWSDLFRHAAELVDKILRGAKPADLPVEQPTMFELVINLKTAKALGLDIPPALLARADEVIE
jgi:putative tryptophan/tyrosine transport system substrate-binding protein